MSTLRARLTAYLSCLPAQEPAERPASVLSEDEDSEASPVPKRRRTSCSQGPEEDEEDEEDGDNHTQDYPGTPQWSDVASEHSKTTEGDASLSEPSDTDDSVRVLLPLYLRNIQCALCCETRQALQDAHTDESLSITALAGYELERTLLHEERLSDTCALVAPCGVDNHVYCVQCLRYLAVDCVEQTLQRMGVMTCPSHTPDDPCCDPQHRPFVFTPESLRYLLTPLELVHFVRLSERYRHKRPGAVASDRYNHFAWSPGKLTLPYPALVPHTQLNPQSLAQQVTHILSADPPDVKCPECGVFLRKTSECNALSHCALEICNICGFSDISIPPSHWHGSCPRFEYDSDQWKAATGLRCQPGLCYDDGTECTTASHRTGLANSHDRRKTQQVRGLWHSLPPDLQTQVQRLLTPHHQTQLLSRLSQ